jgi:hypothetical protein
VNDINPTDAKSNAIQTFIFTHNCPKGQLAIADVAATLTKG